MSAQAAHASDRQQAVLEAALELFVERGFYGTTVPEIAQRAGVGTGTIYRYFSSKEALVNALYRSLKGELLSTLMKDGAPEGTSVRAQFHGLFQRFGQFALERPNAMHFLELHHHVSYLDEESQALERLLLDTIYGMFQVAIEQEVIKPLPPPFLLALLWGAFIGLFKTCASGELELNAATLDALEACCWEAIRR